jgi:chemotaxis protein methyltransferase CheR
MPGARTAPPVLYGASGWQAARQERKVYLMLEQPSLTDTEFEKISSFVKETCGIDLRVGKRELVKARLGKRLRNLGMKTFDDYFQRVHEDASGVELTFMLDALATNVTSFFREPQHFDYVRTAVVQRAAASKGSPKRLRVWSAGCSSGEEPYSIAISILEALYNLQGWDVGILATDLSGKALEYARRGVYPAERLDSMPKGLTAKYFTSEGRGEKKEFRVTQAVRSLVTFAKLNLVGHWPVKGPFDAILCRNVMIYFNKETQTRLINRFAGLLAVEGVLCIGHSESLAGVKHNLDYVAPTIYCRKR